MTRVCFGGNINQPLDRDNRVTSNAGLQTATFGAGCFWGVEATFRRLEGVVSTAVGYMGGTLEDPTYEDVCSGKTGHAEVVELVFEPDRITYYELLDVLWSSHDPTTPGRQGPDVGSQYRSVVFFHDAEQQAAALASRRRLIEIGRFSAEIVTEIVPATQFYRAEEYHQQYLQKRGLAGCTTRSAP